MSVWLEVLKGSLEYSIPLGVAMLVILFIAFVFKYHQKEVRKHYDEIFSKLTSLNGNYLEQINYYKNENQDLQSRLNSKESEIKKLKRQLQKYEEKKEG